MRRRPFHQMVLLCLLVAAAAVANSPQNTNSRGVTLEGHDPVAYFTEGSPLKGDASLQHEWNGAVWYFANAENRDRFAAAPGDFAPQYGGYCAYAMARSKMAKIDPDAWTVADGKLYLNYNRSVRGKWLEDQAGYIRKADVYWQRHLADD